MLGERMKLRPGPRDWRKAAQVAVLLAGNLLFFLTIWLANKYDDVSLDQFIYQLKSSAAGANRSIFNSAVVRVGVFGVAATVLEMLLYRLCAGHVKEAWKRNRSYIRFRASKFSRFIVRRTLPLVMAVLLMSAAMFTVKLDLVQFVSAATSESVFIENHYVDPNDIDLIFPDQKRNLIYIFLESMEVTFGQTEAGGPIYDDYIPELTALAASGEPFNFTMLTCDTHFPDGYVCRLCGEEYDEQYPNVLRCSSAQVGEFIEWIKDQPFYEDTTIVISGDHLTMDPDFMQDVDENYVRTVYNCIINSAVEPEREKERTFGTFDLFPTTLAAMGVEIPGERLGLGTNLFSGKPTWAELYGYENLDWELQKKSEFYNTRFLEMDEES